MKKIIFVFECLSCVALAAILALMMFQSILRSFFNTGMSWTNEMLYFSHILLIYCIVPVLFAENENIRVDVFFNKLPQRFKKWGWIVLESISLVFGIIFFASITQFIQQTWNNSTAIMNIPNYVFYGPIWFGMLFSVISIFLNLIRTMTEKRGAV